MERGVLPARVNQHVSIIRAAENISPRYLHLHMLQKKTKHYLLGMNAGGSREATKGHLEYVPIIQPGYSVLDEFHETVETFYEKREVLVEEGLCLTKLRDTLLPKLLSGELRIPEAEQLIKDAV